MFQKYIPKPLWDAKSSNNANSDMYNEYLCNSDDPPVLVDNNQSGLR